MTLHVPELSKQSNQKETLVDRVLKYTVKGLTGAVIGSFFGVGVALSKYIIEDKDILNFIESSQNLLEYGLVGAVIGLPVGLVRYYRFRNAREKI
tara:strand:+ start:22864 stop:23148 length:285 start_codon:yes stop_codon:yes gene_type:complete